MKPSVGDLVRGKYRIQRVIGDGGMGSVFEARHEGLDNVVALKFLHTDLARRPGLAARFAREARVAAGIQSPHVTRVNDVDTTEDGTPFIVMELLQGQSLATVLSREPGGRLSPDEAVDVTLQILSGLEAAHGRGVVHRDLKPDNVFVTPSPGGPVVKLFDFGIAKVRESKEFSRGLTHAGILMGTPEYMAPEQLYSAAGVDHRADLYSLGVMLFEMLAGELPAQGESAAAIVAQVQQGLGKRLEDLVPGLPPGLVDVVRIALSPDPDQRFESAYVMRQELARFAGNLSHAGQLAATRTSITTPPSPAHAGGSHIGAASAAPLASRVASLASDGAGVSEVPAPVMGVPDTVPPEQTSLQRGTSLTARPVQDPQRPSTVLTPAVGPVGAPNFDPLRASDVRLPPRAGQPPVMRPKKSGALPWVLGSLAVLLGGAIGLVAYHQHRSDTSSPPPLAAPRSAPATRTSADTDTPSATTPASSSANGSDEARPASSTTSETPRSSSQPATHRTPPAPAQATGGSTSKPSDQKPAEKPEDPPSPFGFPLPVPSTLPPLPSSLPPLPESLTSALPTSFPPIFQQPPAQKDDKKHQNDDPKQE